MYLLFDTETTGLPKDWSASASDSENWPRMVQLAFAHYDEFGNKLAEHCYVIKPEGYEISEEVSNIHRVTQERAMKEGVPLEYALLQFSLTMSQSKVLIAHNINFDKKIIGAEYIRKGMGEIYEEIKSIERVCTMMSTTKFCELPGSRGFKWPKLQELHIKLFGVEFEEAHDALVDVRAMAKCFFELKDRKIL